MKGVERLLVGVGGGGRQGAALIQAKELAVRDIVGTVDWQSRLFLYLATLQTCLLAEKAVAIAAGNPLELRVLA